MVLRYEKIHACPNDCILYRGEFESLKSCPRCNVSRYKKREGVPAKVLWYFPRIPTFKPFPKEEQVPKELNLTRPRSASSQTPSASDHTVPSTYSHQIIDELREVWISYVSENDQPGDDDDDDLFEL